MKESDGTPFFLPTSLRRPDFLKIMHRNLIQLLWVGGRSWWLLLAKGAAVVDIDGIAVDKALVDSVFGESMLFATREQHDARVQVSFATL